MFSFFGKKRIKNVAVVDLSSMSASVAYTTIKGTAAPLVVHTAHTDAEVHGAGASGALRALDTVARSMVKEGAAKLRKASGTGALDEVLLLIEHPWQTTKLDVKSYAKEKPFIFTHAMLSEALSVKEGSAVLVGASLNGYETEDPVGKHVLRAELSVLVSTTDPEVERLAKRAVRSFAGSAPITLASFPDAATYVLRGFFPHERDFLAVRVGYASTEIAHVKQGRLAGIEVAHEGAGALIEAGKSSGVSTGAVTGLIDKEKSAKLDAALSDAESKWISAMHEAFLKAASEGALPRVIFLFADERVLPLFKRLLDAPELHTLWLSDEPLSVMPLTKGQFAPFLQLLPTTEGGDPMLDLLCLHARLR
jgi:hypothetical protein